MGRRSSQTSFLPNLFPFLNILTCTAGVLSFIILATGLISVMAPSVVITMRQTQEGFRKHPIYLECQQDRLIIHPQKTVIPRDSIALNEPKFSAFLQRMAEKADQQYVVFTIYPQGEVTFRLANEAIKEKNARMAESDKKIDVGYEPLNRNWRLIFKEESTVNGS